MSRPKRAEGSPLDEALMERALREAGKGRPSPAPRMGAVLARGPRVIAVAHRSRAAGLDPIRGVLRRAGGGARGATLYLSFERWAADSAAVDGADLVADVIGAGIARLVVGCSDAAVVRSGARARLRAAGIEVAGGVCRQRAEARVADFVKWAEQRLPHVTLKAAVTLDGRIATARGDSKWITSEAARREAHRMRAEADAVLVGVSTVLADDPELTVRLSRGPNPLRVVLDSRLRTPLRSRLVRGARRQPTLILCGPGASAGRRRALERAGVELHAVPLARGGGLRLRSALRELARRDVLRLLVEGGGQVHGAFLDAGLVDRAAVFVAPRILGDAQGLPLAAGRRKARIADGFTLQDPRVRRFGPDVLIEGDLRSRL